MVRDSKGWWIDRRRSVTRYSLPASCRYRIPPAFPTFRFLRRPIPRAALGWPVDSHPLVLLRMQGYPGIFSVNAASMFSQRRRGLSMASTVPRYPSPPPAPCPVSRISRSSFRAPSAFYSAILEYCSCYTVADTDRANCSIFLSRWSQCIDLESRWWRRSGIRRLEIRASGKPREEIGFPGRLDNARSMHVHFDFDFCAPCGPSGARTRTTFLKPDISVSETVLVFSSSQR